MANTYNICTKLQAIADAITQGGGGGGGTTVIANPSGTPTADLNTVQIGQTIYDIPGGGGGTGYTETTLWSGTATTSPITLSDSVLNYDAIYVECMFNNEAIMCNTIDKETFTTHLGTNYIGFTSHSNQYLGITPASTATSFTFFSNAVNGCTNVIGIKYARGGGSDQAIDINYDNTTSALTATNVQDAIDENAADISTLNSKTLKQLWVNTSPTSNFSAQSIALSSSDYDYLILITKNAAASSGAMSIMALKGMGFYTQWCNRDGNYPMLAYRFIQYTDDTHYSVPAATTTSHVSGLGSNDSYLVPIAIYGGKF